MLRKDDAGRQILDHIESQIKDFENIDNKMDWIECRHYLAHILDQQNYKTNTTNSIITFCSLEQSRFLKFDGLILASADKAHLPGSNSNYIFFNESIRSELNIPTWRDANAVKMYHFRMILEFSHNIFITAQFEQNDENTQLCPWVEAIETFHKFAYGEDLTDIEITGLIKEDNYTIIKPQNIPYQSQFHCL